MKQLGSPRKSVNWNGPLRAVVLMALLLPLFGGLTQPLGSGTHATPQAQPILMQMAAQRPDAGVSVIVQKATKSNSPEAMVEQLGGRVTRDLSIINAFSAQMPAQAAVQLARTEAVRWVSLDAPTVQSVAPCPAPCIDVDNLNSLYPKTTGANRLWNTAPYLQGQGVGVAVLDSGIDSVNDLRGALYNGSRILRHVSLNGNNNTNDTYGHGTHVAGIIGGNGADSSGRYIGVAPRVNLVSVKVSDDQGLGRTSDVVAGLQWVLQNKTLYNIRVVNISLNSNLAESYHTSALDAACEVLWFNGIVVVTSAGNNGTGTLFPPANDPFVITVGAADEQGTVSASDDTTAVFSASGLTADGFSKPDLVAPGRYITSLRPNSRSNLSRDHPEAMVSGFVGSESYFRMSGTSVAAPVVAGAVALLLQDEPTLTPDQVKYRLKATAIADPLRWPGYDPLRAGAGYLDIYAAVNGSTTQSANTGTQASMLLWTGNQPATWGSVNWNSVNWNSVNWNSVNWNSVNWNSVNWNSDYWGQ